MCIYYIIIIVIYNRICATACADTHSNTFCIILILHVQLYKITAHNAGGAVCVNACIMG